MTACPFCDRIRAGDYDSFAADSDTAFAADSDVVWFEPPSPVTPGHLLFVPVLHVADALESPYVTAITTEIASRYAQRQRAMALPDEQAFNLITSAGGAATQSVYHLHVHLIPRSEGDGLHLPWTPQQRKET